MKYITKYISSTQANKENIASPLDVSLVSSLLLPHRGNQHPDFYNARFPAWLFCFVLLCVFFFLIFSICLFGCTGS